MICPKCHSIDHRDRFELHRKDETDNAFICDMCNSYVCPECGKLFEAPNWKIPWDYPGQIKRQYTCKCGNKKYLVAQQE